MSNNDNKIEQRDMAVVLVDNEDEDISLPKECGPACGLGNCSTCFIYMSKREALFRKFQRIMSQYEDYLHANIKIGISEAIYVLLFNNGYGAHVNFSRTNYGHLFDSAEVTLVYVTNPNTNSYKSLYDPDAPQSVRDTFLMRHPTVSYYRITEIPSILEEIKEL